MFFLKDKRFLNLKTKEIKPNKYSFSDDILSVKVSGKVRRISVAAFLGCSKIKTLEFGEGVEVIGGSAFANCASLTRVALPESLKQLGKYAFKDCASLSEVYLPDNLEALPQGAFENCFGLKKIVLPKNLKEIGAECFSGCIALEEIVFPHNLVKIDTKAFKRCGKIQKLSLPDSLKYLGDFAFDYCGDIQYVNFKGVLDTLGRQPFCERLYEKINVSDMAYVSSFTVKKDDGKCPVISIPAGVSFLSLGFEGVVSLKGKNDKRTCYNHILSIPAQEIKLFMSEHYYSYADDKDYLVENGEFCFEKYDKQFHKADDKEIPYIAAFRLAYDKYLCEEYRAAYEEALRGKEKKVAVFAVEINEAKVLSYVLSNYSFDTMFCTELYNMALRNGNRNLSEIIICEYKNIGVSETEDMFSYLLDN